MLRKLSIALAATFAAAGIAAAAQPQSPFPMSPNETGPYEPDVYIAQTGSLPATAAGAPAGPFPVSVSESGLNDPDIYAVSPRDDRARPSRVQARAPGRFGSATDDGAAQATVRLDPSARYLNVKHFERVRLVDAKGKSFSWQFDTPDETHFPLSAIAPSGFDAAGTIVYVSHPSGHVATD